jgi:hypothetical protein
LGIKNIKLIFKVQILSISNLNVLTCFSCEAVDEIISVESLQFNFATIRVATENFSDANKLGQGGFGVVYKVIWQYRYHIFM